MLKNYLRNILVTLILLFPLHGFAADAFNLKQLQELFKTYQRQQAYAYASQHLEQMEGDPYFDYLYGVSAIDTGHASEGVFALERVLLAFPEDHVARLELARGYFILEEYARSRVEFEIVLKTEPPKKVQETALLFLDKIRLQEARYRTTSNGYVEIAMGTDSNVNSAPTEEGFTNLLPGLTPDPDSIEQDDVFTNLTASWQITHPIAPGWLANGSITGSMRKNADYDQFDNMTATLQAGITKLYKDSRYKASILSQQYNLDGDDYRSLNGLNMDWRYAISQKSNITTAFQYADLEYPDTPSKDSSLMSINLGYSQSFAIMFSPTVFISASVGSETAKEDNPASQSITERDITGLRAGVMLGLSQKTALQLAGAIQTSEYAGPHILNLTANREDDHVSTDLNLLWLFARDWRLDARFSYSDNRSNVEIFRYDRTQVSLNLNYAF